jgi:hypothetical protein
MNADINTQPNIFKSSKVLPVSELKQTHVISVAAISKTKDQQGNSIIYGG